VEEGIVRDDIPGSKNLGSRDYWVGVRELGELVGAFPARAIERNGRVSTCVAAPGTEGVGTRVCGYANKDGRVIVYALANTRACAA
jgi:hypothetical protein